MKRYISVALLVLGVVLTGAGTWLLLDGEREYASAREEYYAGSADSAGYVSASAPETYAAWTETSAAETGERVPDTSGHEAIPAASRTEPAVPLSWLSDINPDFAGWITVENVLDYPVVRGRDNDVYR